MMNQDQARELVALLPGARLHPAWVTERYVAFLTADVSIADTDTYQHLQLALDNAARVGAAGFVPYLFAAMVRERTRER